MDHGPASPNERLLSCPNCFCLNASSAKICIVCGRPLLNRDTSEEQKLPLDVKSALSKDVSSTGIPFPATSKYLPLSTSQQQASQDSQHTPSHVQTEKKAPTVDPGSQASAKLSIKDAHEHQSFLVMQPAPRRHGNLPVSSDTKAKETHPLIEDGEWSCDYCTLINPDSTSICQVCSKSRTASSTMGELVETLKPLQSIAGEAQVKSHFFFICMFSCYRSVLLLC